MKKLVLIRHGESIWNKKNRFTGWTDIDLSETGVEEALSAGKILKNDDISFDIAFTSVLRRSIKTLWIILEHMDLMWIPVEKSWRLNERHYGALQGLNKKDTTLKHGAEQVHIWRRSYDVPPPPLNVTDARYPGNNIKYRNLTPAEIPVTECLKDTVERFMPYWHSHIVPQIELDKKVIIAAHGNSLRALVKHLDNISDDEIPSLNIPTGIPLIYELDNNLKPLTHYYLGDPEKIRKATKKVANQDTI